jgi:hypothetical protein
VTRLNRRLLWAILAAGAAVRLVIAFSTYGDGPDMDALHLMAEALAEDPLHVYTVVNAGEIDRLPYPSGYFPWIAASRALHETIGLPFHGWVQVAPIAADLAIAWIVQDHLGRVGARQAARLLAAGAVALGPSFGVISGYQCQFDSVAILPALLGVLVWTRGSPRRALVAGALIGLGGAVKITPLLLLLALLPSARRPREALVLGASAAGVLLLAMLPYLLSEPGAVRDALGYAGLPGAGGLTLALQPGLAENWLVAPTVDPNRVVGWLSGHSFAVNLALAAGAGALLLRCRARPVEAAVVLWLAVYAFAPGFFFQYAVWGLPFFLLAGHVRKAIALQLALIGPAVVFYSRPWGDDAVVVPYSLLMVAVWAALAITLAASVRSLWARRPRSVASLG